MERKIITHTDFKEIGKNNDYFLWHFLQKDQEKNIFNIFSIFKEKEDSDNLLNEILEKLDISYYESYVEESIDFLISSGINQKIWEPPVNGANPDPKFLFKPVFLLYKGYNLKSSTFQTCYCPEGIIDMIGKENPDLLSGF
jgi:hypothetical protein